MTKKVSIIVVICFISLLGCVIFLDTLCKRKSITISYISNLQECLLENDIMFPETNDIHFYILNDNEVLVVDTRNFDYRLYVNSVITVEQNNEGVLSVVITDSIAVSETNISGIYGVIIKCNTKISDVLITRRND